MTISRIKNKLTNLYREKEILRVKCKNYYEEGKFAGFTSCQALLHCINEEIKSLEKSLKNKK